MLALRNSSHIRTNRNVRSFRSCLTSTGSPLAHLDRERVGREEARRARREARRAWLAMSWKERRAPLGQLLWRILTP